MSRMFSMMAVAIVLCGSMLFLGGCQRRITKQDVWKNPSPAKESIAHTKDERKNKQIRAMDTTMRQLHDDWDRFWLIDRPLYLSEYPIP